MVRLPLGLLFLTLTLTCFSDSCNGADPEDWPQWRGPARDGVGSSQGLLTAWPEGGPEVLWRCDTVGVGYASLAVADGRIFTQGDLDGVEHVMALSTQDGQVIWQVQPGNLAEQLAAKATQELKRADKNDNGVVEELEALQAYGWDFNKFDRPVDAPAAETTASRAAQLLKALDADQDGKLSFAELRPYSRGLRFSALDTEDKAAEADELAGRRVAGLLAAADQDGDGKLSRKEARDTEIDRDFNRADKRDKATNKGDELLTLDELLDHYSQAERGRDGQISGAELAEFYARHYKNPGDGQLTADELKSYYGGYRNGMGDGPRGTPTVDGNRVYAEGGQGDISCLDAQTGRTIWHRNLRADFDGGVPGWGYSESPLIEGDLLIVTPGGKAGTMVALHKATGELAWTTAGESQRAHYSSPVAADIHGVRQIVQFAHSSVFGVDAATGKRLWSYSAANNGTANCATPLVWNNHVFASSGYGTGGGLARIEKSSDGFAAEQVYFEKKMANHHGGIVRVGDHMYGFGSGGLICMHFLTGEIAWTARSVNKGSLLSADGLLFLVGENHHVALAAADPQEYRELGTLTLEEHGRPSWAHPALARGVLLIRDQQSLTAYKVR